MQALKYAFLSVAAGMTQTAVACGSERFSAWMQSSRFEAEMENMKTLEDNPILAFEKDFLRWMLSDGAGAALLQPKPNEDGISLRIEWIELTSYANEQATCMYSGGVLAEDKSMQGWNEFGPSEWLTQSMFSFRQDTRQLGANIVPYGGRFLETLMKKHDFDGSDVDYYMPHMSSEFFKNQIHEYHQKIGMDIPWEKWFYNLPKVGNVGSASPFLMLDEFWKTGRFKKGDRILMMVPESARFTYAYIYLTVV